VGAVGRVLPASPHQMFDMMLNGAPPPDDDNEH
jgi:hypothetical protein